MLGMIFKTLKVKQITDDIGDHQILRYTLEQEGWLAGHIGDKFGLRGPL